MMVVPGLGDTEHLFRSVVPDLVAGGGHRTDALLHRERVPRFAHAEAVDDAARQAVAHLLGRQHDDAHVALRIHATRAQPHAQLEGMHREQVHRGEREGLGAGSARYPRAQGSGHARRAAITLAAERVPQRPRQRDGVAVQRQRQPCQQVGAHAAGTVPGHHRQGRQQVRGVELAHHQLVAQIRPRHLARERDLEPVTREQPGFTRHHQRRAVAETHEAQRQRGLFRRRKLLVATHRLLPLSLPPGDSVASTVLATSGSRWLASIASLVSMRWAASSLSC